MISQQAGTFSVNLYDHFAPVDQPIVLALSGWIDTADVTDTSIMQFAVNYVDATGNAHQALFQATPQIIMNDPTQFFTTDAVMLRRQWSDPQSNFKLDGTLVFGTPGGARYTINLVRIDNYPYSVTV